MPVTLRNTDILFNNGTTQSTAAVVDTTAVLNATAGASVGAVGTYAQCNLVVGGGFFEILPGATVAGSSLRYSGVPGIVGGTTPVGTWRVFGYIVSNAYQSQRVTLFLRIS